MRRLKYCLHCLKVRHCLNFLIFVVRNGTNRRTDFTYFLGISLQVCNHYFLPPPCAAPRVTGTYANVDRCSTWFGSDYSAGCRYCKQVCRRSVTWASARASKVGVTVPAATQGSRAAAGDRKRESVTAAASGSGAVRRLNRRARGARDGCRFEGAQPGAFFFA